VANAGIESTIIGFEDGSAVLYRLGSITIEEIGNVIGPLKNKKTKEKNTICQVCFQTLC
jgi:L-threonylcarbamoyladenylate synthase